MQKFDLELAKAGREVITKEGYPVRIICYDKMDDRFPLVALVKHENSEITKNYTIDGKYIEGDNTDLDLFLADPYNDKSNEIKEEMQELMNEVGNINARMCEKIEEFFDNLYRVKNVSSIVFDRVINNDDTLIGLNYEVEHRLVYVHWDYDGDDWGMEDYDLSDLTCDTLHDILYHLSEGDWHSLTEEERN